MLKLKTKLVQLTIILILVASYTSKSQSNLWFFGSNYFINNGEDSITSFGLDFSGSKLVENHSQTKINFNESVSVVSDEYGKLLMYSDGVFIVDASHRLMFGAPLNLKGPLVGGPKDYGSRKNGYTSAAQGVLSVNKPNSKNIIYQFTTSSMEHSSDNGFRVNTIDLALSGNGSSSRPLGEVISYDSLLYNSSSEMLTTYIDCSSDSIWVIAHNRGNKFIKVLITSSGIESVTTQEVNSPNQWNKGWISSPNVARGTMDISPQGDKLVMSGEWPIGTHYFDFDKHTGEISNHKNILNRQGSQLNGHATEFSPDGSIIYITSIMDLYQFDVENETIYLLDSNQSFGEIVTGVDGKLYFGKNINYGYSQYLGTIDSPNNFGVSASGYFYNSIKVTDVDNLGVTFGLPQDKFCWVDRITSSKEKEVIPKAKTKVFPNPVVNELYLNGIEPGMKITIFSLEGKAVKTINSLNINRFVEVSDLRPGSYILGVFSESEILYSEVFMKN